MSSPNFTQSKACFLPAGMGSDRTPEASSPQRLFFRLFKKLALADPKAAPAPAPHEPRAWAPSWRRICLALASVLSLGWATPAFANIDISSWTCTGECGTLGADGVVTLSPVTGATSYGYVTTAASHAYAPGARLNFSGDKVVPGLVADSILATLEKTGGASVNGSRIQSPVFNAAGGEKLSFYFNYVSSDGGSYADYAWARLTDGTGKEVAMLFASRITDSGNTVPGINMPPPVATLTPASAPIIAEPSGFGPNWSPLADRSGQCYAEGCGHTGWVHAMYAIPAAGKYRLEFGVMNWGDAAWPSGLAFDGMVVVNSPSPPVCTATPNPVLASEPVGIRCTVDAGTMNNIPHATCMETSAVGTEVVCNGIAGEIGSNPTITSDDMKGHIATATVPLTVLPAGTNPPVCTATPNPAADGDAVTIDCTVDAGTTNAIAGADLLAGVKCTPNPATGTGAVSITCTGYGATIGNNPPVTSKDAAGRSTTGIVPLQIKQAAGLLIAFKVPVCTATPNPAQAGETVSITCTGGVVSDRLTIPGTNCAGAFISGKSITCTGTAGIAADQLNNNPAVTVLNESGIFNSGVVPFQIQGGTTAPPLPVCTAVPNPAGLSTSVTIACTGGTPGHTLTIAGSDCAGVVISDSGTAICSGKGGDLGNNPILTVATGPGSGNISQGTVPLFVKTAVPSVPVCKANPNPVSPSATVTITCTVDAGTTNTIAGAACTPPSLGGSLTCTGTGKDIGNDPTIASTNPAGNTTTAIVPLTVLKGPNPPVCTATPSLAAPSDKVTITCTVDKGTTTTIPGATCVTKGTKATCTGTGASLGNNPPATSTDAAGNSSTGIVPLQIEQRHGIVPPKVPVCTAKPNPAAAGATVTITCEGGTAGNKVTIPGTNCTDTVIPAGGSATCTGTAGTGAGEINNNPPVTVTDPETGLSNSGVVPFQIENSTFAPPLPVCTAVPNPAGKATNVTITCEGGTPGHTLTIAGSDCTGAAIPASGTVTCKGTGSALGNNPILTVTNPVSGASSQGTVPLLVRTLAPATPVCKATPNPVDIKAEVTITCTVDAGTTNAIPGATCTTTGTTAVCKGIGEVVKPNPTITSTDDTGQTATAVVDLTVTGYVPPPPVSGAQPIPSLSDWSLIALALMLLGMSAVTLRKGGRR